MTRSTNRSRARQNPRSRSLNAFAIASAQNPVKSGVPARRLGQKPARSKRQRSSKNDDEEDEDEDGGDRNRGDRDDREIVDGGNDSEGNEWKLGQVDSDDDSDLDSDEAMGESDEERFADFIFRGSSFGKGKRGKKGEEDMDLSEGEDYEDSEDGEGYIDLSEMLDRPESEEGEENPKRRSKKRSAPTDFSGEENLELNEDEDESISSADDESGSDNDTESLTHFSDEEDNIPEDPAKLDALESLISSLPTSTSQPAAKRVRLNDPNEGKTPNEYNLSLSSSSKKLTIDDLMPSITDPKLKKSLKLISEPAKSNTKKTGVPGKLVAPLAKRQQDRLDRAAAYEQSKETLNRWVDTVKHNREADHLHFPLANAPNAPIEAPSRLTTITPNSSTPLTELESKISGILKESNMTSEKQIQEFEELKMNKMSIEDVQRRTAELRMARELLYREEVKAKRIKKIKSKTYRRIHKKERIKERQAIEEAMRLEKGDLPDEEEEMERERERAEERMSLRHKQSRWAKGLKESGRTIWDDEAKNGAIEMARRNEELRRRIEGKNVRGEDDSDASDSEEEDNEDEFDEEGQGGRESARQWLLNELKKVEAAAKASGGKLESKLMGMKFMRSAEAAKRKENAKALESLRKDLEDGERGSEEDSEEELESSGRMVFKPNRDDKLKVPKTKQTMEEFEEADGNDGDGGEAHEGEEVQFVNKASTTTTSNANKNPFSAPKITDRKFGNKHISFGNRGDDADEEEANPWFPKDPNGTLVKPKVQAIINGKQDSKGARITSKLLKDRKSALKKHQEADEGNGEVEIDVNMTLKIAPKTAEPAKNSRKSAGEDESSDNSEDDHEVNDKDINLVPKKGGRATFESQRELVKRAFAGDDVVREFRKEKKKTVKNEGDRIIDETLPGWGTWTGDGISKKQMKRNKGKVLRKVEGVDKNKRKDRKLANVIINERRIKKNLKYNAPALPHPFENQQQYERSLRVPIGPEWTTKETFQASTMPRVMVKQGRVVEPMTAPFK